MAFHGQGYHWAVRSWHILFIFIPCLATAVPGRLQFFHVAWCWILNHMIWALWSQRWSGSLPPKPRWTFPEWSKSTWSNYFEIFTYIHLHSVSWVLSVLSCLSRRVFPHHCEARADELEKTLQKERAEHKVPGVNVAAAKGTVWVMGYGVFQGDISPQLRRQWAGSDLSVAASTTCVNTCV